MTDTLQFILSHQNETIKPWCRKETAGYRSCSFQFNVRRQHSITTTLVAKLRNSKAMLQSSKHTGPKQNLTQNSPSWSFNVTCVGVSENAMTSSSYLLRFLQLFVYERYTILSPTAIFCGSRFSRSASARLCW